MIGDIFLKMAERAIDAPCFDYVLSFRSDADDNFKDDNSIFFEFTSENCHSFLTFYMNKIRISFSPKSVMFEGICEKQIDGKHREEVLCSGTHETDLGIARKIAYEEMVSCHLKHLKDSCKDLMIRS